MRLTRKYDDNSGYEIVNACPQEQHLYIDLNAYDDIKSKLGKLEDFEEELGIDLVTFMKVRYAYFHNKQICFRKEAISFGRINYLGEKSVFVTYYNSRTTMYSTITLKYINYGKTWALSKEELE